METIRLKDEVSRALDVEWQAFVARHPHLAEVIDRELLVEQAVAGLSEHPEFREAMEQAAAAGLAGNSLVDLVQRFVGDWLRRLA